MDHERRRRRKHWVVALLLGLGAVAVATLAQSVGLLEFSELKLMDLGLSVRPPAAPHPDLALVAIDDEAQQQLVTWLPLPRAELAAILRRLTQARPAVIALDVLLDQDLAPEDDAELAQAIREAGNVVLARVLDESPDGPPTMRPLRPRFRGIAAAEGFTNLRETRADGLVRSFAPRVPGADGMAHRQFAALAVGLYARRLGLPPPKLMARTSVPIDFAGPPGTIGGTSSAALQRLPVQALKELYQDKIVLVGATFAELPDKLLTPYNGWPARRRSEGMCGVEVLANCINTLLNDRTTAQAGSAPTYALAFVLSALAALAFLRAPLWMAVPVLMVLGLCAPLVSLWTFIAWDVHLPAMPAVLAVAVACPSAFAYHQLTERRLRKQLEMIFGGYVSDQVLDHLVARGKPPALGGETRDVAILFSDIRDYGTLAEKLKDEPHEIVRLLNEHFSAMTDCIQRQGGCVDSFVGDLIVGVFGVPQEDPRAARHAVQAGLDMLRAIATQNEERRRKGQQIIRAGVGIHCGEVVAGNIGSPRRMNYTVIGDAVNVASRLEGLTKELGVPLLVSQEVVDRLGAEVEHRFLAEVQVKSRSGVVRVYEAMGLRGQSESEG